MPDVDFEHWLAHMGDTLDSLVNRLRGIKLDYSALAR